MLINCRLRDDEVLGDVLGGRRCWKSELFYSFQESGFHVLLMFGMFEYCKDM